jgi:fermentation-respiration switch protein FrsA (DUF1100 family)
MTAAPTTGRRRLTRFAVRWAIFLTLLWAGSVVVMKSQENRLAFVPTRANAAWADPPDPAVQDVWLTAADGTRLHAWYLPADGDRGAVLLSHGNAGNVSGRGPMMLGLRRHLGRSVLAYDYPGFGRSGGEPTEAGCYAAGDAAYRWLTEDRRVPPGKVVLLGESLGGGVAVELATHHDHEALALLYTFTSLPDAADSHYPWLPCRALMSNRFDSLSKIGRCQRPVFVIHGTADEVVPFTQGERLFAAANEPKRFVPVEGAAHGADFGDGFYVALKQFLDERR